jgi:acyl-CoA thioester hydrolase
MAKDAVKAAREAQEEFRERGHYKYFMEMQTRWSDNDQYGIHDLGTDWADRLGHVNNARYLDFTDMAINIYLSSLEIGLFSDAS